MSDIQEEEFLESSEDEVEGAASRLGNSTDNAAASEAVASTIGAPPDRANDSRRMVAVGRIGPAFFSDWNATSNPDEQSRTVGSLQYDGLHFFRNSPNGMAIKPDVLPMETSIKEYKDTNDGSTNWHPKSGEYLEEILQQWDDKSGSNNE